MHSTMLSYHQPSLVGLSVLIAILASFAALDLAGRVAQSRGRAQLNWLAGGAVAMGIGIWSMHYVGMLAFHLPVPVLYHVPTVLISLLAAVLASAVALRVVSRRSMTPVQAISGSVVMGLGISAMHYTGMAAMRLPGTTHYSVPLVATSVLVAMVVSLVALWLAFRFSHTATRTHVWRKLCGAFVMGVAIPSMHYTAMAAAHFTAAPGAGDAGLSIEIPLLGIVAVVGTSFLVLAAAIVTSVLDRRFSIQATALEVSQRALLEQQRFLLAIVDANPHLIFVKDWDGRFTLANKAVAQIYGTTPDGLVGRTDAEFNPNAEEVARFLRDDRNVMTSGEPLSIREEAVTNPETGQTRWFETIKVPFVQSEGGLPQVLGVATDITMRKQLEAQLRQSQKMEAVGRLAGGVAHDFNNVLTAIFGYADLLLDQFAEDDPRRADLAEVKRSTLRAAGLTRQLLAFSRKQILQPKVLDLNAVMMGMGTFLRRLIGEDVELRIDRGKGVGAVKADPGQLEQVFMNLAVNARDAMPRGGKLTIETANVHLDEAAARRHVGVTSGEYVMTAVSDTGVGMDERVKAHLFEPFFTTKEQGQGTGLGLATVYGIVQQSGGFIDVVSEWGRGSTFKVYLPRVAGTAETMDPVVAESPITRTASGTIMLAEDEEPVRRLISRMLKGLGYNVLIAADGEQALDMINRYPGKIDLLITDVVMPRLGGRELAERVHPKHPDTKVLFISGYTDDAIVRHGVLDSGVAFLQKPFSPDGLARMVTDALRQN